MKKKSASQSAFFNLRVLIGLFMALAGVFLALLAFGVLSPASTAQAQQRPKIIDVPGLPPGFDCSKIHQLGIDRQENLRAGLIMIACGESEGGSGELEGGSPSNGDAASRLIQNLLPSQLKSPDFIGNADVDVILPDGTYPHVTQSESMSWGGPNNTWVVNYNDSRTAGACYSGISYTTDNGVTWQHNGQPLCSGHGSNYGDPIVVYNAHLNMWFAGDLATGCGGLGVGLWTSPNGITWAPGACAHTSSNDDRESFWVDNNPASPNYGRMYISFNNFNIGGGALFVTHSDDGVTWTTAQLSSGFVRDNQITGDLQGSGRVYVLGMNEGGGGLNLRQNVVYRSSDGGATWLSSTAGPSFQGPGRAVSGYFALAFSSIWRHMGWGQPGASGNVVSIDYASCGIPTGGACNTQSDHGDIYYNRSTDAGVTWGTPVKLNTDAGTAMQWQPSLTVTQGGAIFASWYDEREANGGADTNCSVGNPNVPCYRRWGRVSLDNGATWQPDDQVGRAISPLPAQPDGSVQSTYEGDYDYHSSLGMMTIGGWTDGRTPINGVSQQDVFVNLAQLGGGSCTPGWSAGPDLPSVGIRLVGVYFPANGKFYAMGGRSSDSAGSDFTHPFEYNPGTNAWTTKSATYTDNQVNNMACGVLALGSTPYIYCVGGSAAGAASATARVFYYDPIADSLTYLNAADNWPGDAAGTILPGGFAETGNKMYILGGFNINTASTTDIWQFDPTAAVGSKWLQRVSTPEGVMYAPTCAIGGIIYLAGASDWNGSTVIDTTNSFSFNPMTNTIGAITAIPRATGETRALNFNGKMLVMGGGRVAPNPSNEVDTYDPGTNSWTVNSPVPAFMTARRNFPTDTDGASRIWLAGGYATDNVTPLSSMEIYNLCAPTLTGAVSRKTHGAAGTFDVNMPVMGSSGVEPRSGGSTRDYTLVATFSGNVTVTGSPQSQVVSGTGCVGSGGICDPNGTVTVNANMVTVPLTNVADVQVINVQINGVNSAADMPAVNVNIPMGILIGDVSGNRTVNASDVALDKSQVGQPVGNGNFREDVNASGTITATDVAIVKSDVGHSLPP